MTRLQTITALASRSYDTRPDRILPPCAWPELVGDEGWITFADDAVWLYDLYLLVKAERSLTKADQLLKPYIARSGASSVYVALTGDLTLNGAADSIRNIRLTQRGRIEIGEVVFYGAIWRLEVMAQ